MFLSQTVPVTHNHACEGFSAPLRGCGSVFFVQDSVFVSWNIQVSYVQNPVDIPLYWLFNRDPYNGLLQSPYNWVE